VSNKSIFSTDWFSLGENTFKKTLESFVGVENLTFMEIGSFEGRSAIWMLDNILTGTGSKIICIDTFGGNDEYTSMGVSIEGLKDRFLENMKPYVGKFRVIQGESQDVLRTKDFDNKIDVLYIDGNHTAWGCLTDMVLGFKVLKHGGIMLVDDYMWNFNRLMPSETPKLAVDSFLSCFKDKVTVLGVSWKTIVIKKK
jgi:predicted O-methyltransferase YrrM